MLPPMSASEPTLIPLPDGRVLAVDDVGDSDGSPVLYLHGTPDSRWSRHPDDTLAGAAGIRLLAVDRPGCGRSTPHPGRTLGTVADDLAHLCDHLGIERVGVMAWSAGAPYAMALAARHRDRVGAVALVAPLVPVAALADPAVRTAAGPGRALFAEMAAEMRPDEVAAEVAPYLVPDPATAETVREMHDEGGPVRAAELAQAPGAAEQLVRATLEAVAVSRAGVHDDVATQAAAPDVDLSQVTAPVSIWVGEADEVSPPAFGRWWAGQADPARLTEVAGGGHTIVITHWWEILDQLATALRTA